MSEEMLRAYKAARMMEPVAQVDYYVEVKTYKEEFLRKVTYREAIPPFQVLDIGAIATQTVSARTPAGNLDLQDNEFGQWRWFPLDNTMVRLFNPTGVSKFQLKFIQVGVEKSIIYRDPTLLTTEFFTWQSERPSFEGMNFSDYGLNACRILVFGYRFKVEELDKVTIDKLEAGQLPVTPVVCAGSP